MTGADASGPNEAADRAQPVVERERIVTLDFIRGIAVLGILFPNIVAFGQPYMAYFWPPALNGGMTAADQAVWLFQFVFIDGKFRGLFTVLFGAGLYLFMERAWARGEGRGRLARRLLVLLGFGLVHYFLIWRGDILTVYATWGLVALLTLGWSKEKQLGVGVTMTIAGSLLLTATLGMQYAATSAPGFSAMMPEEARAELAAAPQKTLDEAAAEVTLYREGSYPDIVAYSVTEGAAGLGGELLFAGIGETFGLILLGVALYRLGLFSGAFDRKRLRLWGWAGVIVGCAMSLAAGYWAYAEGFPFHLTIFAFNGLSALPHLFTLFGLLFLLVLWAPGAAHTALGQRFVAAGRMAFSNYLGTSVLMMIVFHGWALGLFGDLHRPELFAVVLAFWLLMLVWSPWWLARFRYGPLEWLWRCLTYGKRFPIRR